MGGGSQPNHPKVPHKIMVPNIYVLRGYAVTPLRICYCINKCTHLLSLVLQQLLLDGYSNYLLSFTFYNKKCFFSFEDKKKSFSQKVNYNDESWKR